MPFTDPRRPLPRLLAAAIATCALAEGHAEATAIKKGPWVQRVTSTSAVVRLEVDPPSPVSVEIGDRDNNKADGGGAGAGPSVFESKEPHALHTITLTNLAPETHYSYSVKLGATAKLAKLTTAPADNADSSFRFLVYGDNRTDDAPHASVVRAMAAVASDFLIHTGDFVERGDSATQWQTFFDIEAPLLETRCLFSAVGNHELTDGLGIDYARYFGPTDLTPDLYDFRNRNVKHHPAASIRPEQLNGTFRWGNTRFFLINGVSNYKVGSVDRNWLESALSAADNEANLKWRIVVSHHGPYSSGPHGNNARFHDAGIPAMFKQHKVDLVLSGHDHIYERGFGSGFAYIVSGGGGAPIYKIKHPNIHARKLEAVRHFIEMTVSPQQIQMTTMRSNDSSIIERCSLSHNATAWDCDGPGGGAPLPNAELAPGETVATPGVEKAPEPKAARRCACGTVGVPSSDLGALVISAAVSAGFLARRRRPRRAAD